MQKHIGKAAAKRVNAPLSVGAFNQPPEKFTYALATFAVERRASGWYVAKAWSAFAREKPRWNGPFETIETACLSIGRHLAVEIADRHTRSVEAHNIKPGQPLYGLKETTRLRTK